MNRQPISVFERHPLLTIIVILVIFLFLFLGVAEVILKQFAGLGEPVLFEKNPTFGYRLRPNQEMYRFQGAHFKINNLGLRADRDWDRSTDHKILFLGDSVTYGGNHLSNESLFSAVAIQGLPNWHSGNGGIPNWGVENVYGLVVGEAFLPASVYVTTSIEKDFYRGLTTGENRPWIAYEKPLFALQELASFLWYRYLRNPRNINRAERDRLARETRAENAVRKLKEMDEYLISKGFRHLIFISPTRMQVVDGDPRDSQVEELLQKHHVPAIYLLDEINRIDASKTQKRNWYQDKAHLTDEGHRVWG